jgi:hypothetical protein
LPTTAHIASADVRTRPIFLTQHIESKLFAPAEMARGMGYDWQATEALDAPCRVPRGSSRAHGAIPEQPVISGWASCAGRI